LLATASLLQPQTLRIYTIDVEGGKATLYSRLRATPLLERGRQGSQRGWIIHCQPFKAENDHGYAIEITARPDGTFTVNNGRNHFEKTYK
jgi:hypothetical protein